MDSLDVRVFATTLNNYIRESSLPAEVKKYVLGDILNQVCREADQEVQLRYSETLNECAKGDKNAESIQQDSMA